MANQYNVGDLVRCKGVFTDASGDRVDPSAVLAKIRKPDDTTVTYTYGIDAALVHESQGVFRVDVTASLDGYWYYRFAATGVGQSAGENCFFVRESEFD